MAFATKERARALASPTNADMTALRHLVRYYRTTSDLELRIQPKTRTRVPEGEPELLSVEAYSDSDWAGCRDTRRSTSGGMIYFEGAVLPFWSRTQTTIALSSCEAELYAINMATIEALNVKSTIEELIKNCKTNITIYTDSSSAKSITSRRGVTRKTKHIELRQLFVQDLVATGTLQVTKVGTLSNPADIFTKFVSSDTIQRQLHAVGLRCTKFEHAIHVIRCVPSDLVEVCETKVHKTRAMAILNFDFSKFFEKERPKYDVKMFGTPYQMAMKIVNDDEFQSVHDFQTLSEKVSITDLLEVRRIGIPHDTQVKMIRVWEEHERFTPDKRKDCPIPQWYGKAIRYDGYELDENLKKARFYEPPHLTILDKVLLTNTKMVKAGKPTNEYVFVPLDYHYDDDIAIMHMSNYSHMVSHEKQQLCLVQS